MRHWLSQSCGALVVCLLAQQQAWHSDAAAFTANGDTRCRLCGSLIDSWMTMGAVVRTRHHHHPPKMSEEETRDTVTTDGVDAR